MNLSKWIKKQFKLIDFDFLTGIIFIIFSVVIYQQSYGFGSFTGLLSLRPEFYPQLIAILMGAIGIYTCILSIFKGSKDKRSKKENTDGWPGWLIAGLFLGGTILYVRYISLIGFIPLTFVYLLVLFWITGGWHWRKPIVAGSVSIILYYIFSNLFQVPLP